MPVQAFSDGNHGTIAIYFLLTCPSMNWSEVLKCISIWPCGINAFLWPLTSDLLGIDDTEFIIQMKMFAAINGLWSSTNSALSLGAFYCRAFVLQVARSTHVAIPELTLISAIQSILWINQGLGSLNLVRTYDCAQKCTYGHVCSSHAHMHSL